MIWLCLKLGYMVYSEFMSILSRENHDRSVISGFYIASFTEPPHHKICWKQSRIQIPLPDVDRGSDYKLSIGFDFLYLLQNIVSGRNSSNFWITNLSTIIYHHQKKTLSLVKANHHLQARPSPLRSWLKTPQKAIYIRYNLHLPIGMSIFFKAGLYSHIYLQLDLPSTPS